MARIMLTELRSLIADEIQMMREAQRCRNEWHAGPPVTMSGEVITACPTCGEKAPERFLRLAKKKAAAAKKKGRVRGESFLRRFVRETVEGEVDTLEPGDLVDVMGGEVDYSGVRVLRFVDDVREETGTPADEDDMHLGGGFTGPGFVGQTNEGDELVFAMDQVVPGSKAKYYFPVEDEPGTGYRGLAGREAWDSTRREDDWHPGHKWD